MRVLHYISNFSLRSETFIFDLINNLEKSGVDNYILTHNRHLECERSFAKINVLSEKTSFIKKVYCKFFKEWRINNEKQIVSFIQLLNPDVIHAHFGPNGIKIASLIKKYNLKIKLLVSFHGMDINVLPVKNKKYLSYLLQLSREQNALFTSPSKFLKRKMQLIGFNPETVKVVPNTYNEYFNIQVDGKCWDHGDELKILNIGRFEEVKGQQYLIKAFKSVIENYQNATLTIIGYGSLECELKKLCEKLNIQHKVHFITHVSHSKLPDIIYSHDIYIQPSIIASDGAEENLSVSTIEAQVCGLPAIVSDIGGLKEIVMDDVTGRLVKEKNSQELADAILFYVNNPEYIMEHSANARRIVTKKFNKIKIVNLIKRTYEKI